MSSKFRQAIEDRIKMLQEAKRKVAKVGIVGHQHYDDKNQTPVAYVAAIHEYGSPSQNIPARPFFRPTIAAQKKAWAKVGRQLLKNGASVEDMLDLVGARAAGDVRETLSQIKSPPLKEATIRAKERKYKSKSEHRPEKPLFASGLLTKSISHVVVDKD